MTRLDCARKYGEWTGGRRNRIYHFNSLLSTRITHSNIMNGRGEMRKRTKEWKKHAELMWRSKEKHTCVSIWKKCKWRDENTKMKALQKNRENSVGLADATSGRVRGSLGWHLHCCLAIRCAQVKKSCHVFEWVMSHIMVMRWVGEFVGAWAGSSLLPRNTWCLGGCVARRSVCVCASSWVSGLAFSILAHNTGWQRFVGCLILIGRFIFKRAL